MKLFQKMLLIILLPVIIASFTAAGHMQTLIDKLEKKVKAEQLLENDAILYNMEELVNHLNYVSKIFTTSGDAVNSVINADNYFLSERSSVFIDSRVSEILFTDLKGMVIARASDEYEFGDSVRQSFYFQQVMDKGSFYGVALVDGIESLVYAESIKRYNQYPVGFVITVRSVNEFILHYLAAGIKSDLEYMSDISSFSTASESMVFKSEMTSPVDIMTESSETGKIFLRIAHKQSDSYVELQNLRDKITRNSIITIIVIALFMFIVLKYHLKPYGQIVSYLSSFRRDGLADLNKKLRDMHNDKDHEIEKVVDSLLEMTSLIESNMELLTRKNEELERISRTDTLTRVNNRLRLDEILSAEASRTKRYNTGFSVILIDIDKFKSVNDTYGHQIGDQVLTFFARILSDNCREIDTVGRWGGEEFMIICPDTNEDGAFKLAAKIHNVLNSTDICEISITASFGISSYICGERVADTVKRVDTALYTAKGRGRNCILKYSDL